MIVKKIPNPKKSASKAQRTSGLMDYISEPHLESGQEKCIHYEATNFMTGTNAAQKLEMVALSEEATRSKDPIDHWVLSFREGEIPTVTQAREAVAMFVEHCGLKDHLYVWGMHEDTDNVHIHIGINRVHPETGKVVKINKGFDREAAHQAIALIEQRQGWQKEQAARYTVDQDGKLVKREPGPEAAPSLPTKLRDMELQTGEKSQLRIAQEKAGQILREATSWQDLHAKLAAVGVRYEREGSGAKVYVGNSSIGLKASDVDRKASFSQLQKRLGAYEPAEQSRTPVRAGERATAPGRTQEPQPLAAGQSGWQAYRTIRAEHKAAKESETRTLRQRQEQERKALATELKAERQRHLQGDWRGKGDLRNALQSVLATQQAAKKAALAERQREERKALLARYAPLPMYRQWQAQPRIVSLDTQPNYVQQAEREKLSDVLKDLRHTIDKRGHVTYQADGKTLFRDEGRSLAVLAPDSDRAIAAALATAQAKFGNTLTLTGSDAFKRQAVAVAVKNNLGVRFDDPALNQMREQLFAEKVRIEREQAQRVAAERAKQLEKLQRSERESSPGMSR